MLRIRDRRERDMLYGPTNEEMITGIFRSSVRSYKDLPLSLYHIQWKFRDEVRPRFGVMRSWSPAPAAARDERIVRPPHASHGAEPGETTASFDESNNSR